MGYESCSTGEQISRSRDDDSFTALLVSAERGYLAVTTLLVEAGADLQETNSGHRPLHLATWLRSMDTYVVRAVEHLRYERQCRPRSSVCRTHSAANDCA